MDRSKWEYKKLTDVCSILYGYPFDSKCFNENDQGHPLIRIRDVVRGFTETYTTESCPDEYIINEGDYLIGMDGEFNIAAWKSRPALLNQRVCKIKADGNNIVNGFMYYLMKTKLKEIESETAFVTVKHLSAKVLNKVNVQLPSIDEQKRVVAELDCLNEMIAVKQEQLKEFDKLTQSLFYDMFGDPVTNEKGWDKSSYGKEFVIGSGGTPSKTIPEYWENGDVPWIGSNMCQNCDIYDNDGKYITPKGLENSSAKVLKEGTVLIALVGATIGKVGLLHKEMATNQNIAYINVWASDLFDSTYVFYHSMNLYQLFLNLGNGGFKMANQGFIKELPIVCPPLALQQQFAEKITAIEAQKELIKASIAETQQLLDSRMDYYFD